MEPNAAALPAPPPFTCAWIAPDTVEYCDPCLTYPPIFERHGDRLLLLLHGDDGTDDPFGVVRAVYRAGPVALVELDHLTYEDDPALVAVVLVRADALPDPLSPAHVRAAAQLRTHYGESLTVGNVAAAGAVTTSAVITAVYRRRIQGTK